MHPQLAITSPEGRTTAVAIEGVRFTLGRSSTNDLSYPDDASLSRRHVILENEGEDWFVRDLASKNGTFVNGRRATDKVRLARGDRIQAGRVLLIFDPLVAAPDPTVIFDREPTSAGATASTSLQRLLSEQTFVARADREAPAYAATAVNALVRAGRELAVRKPLPELFSTILDLAIEAVGAERGVLMTRSKQGLAVQASRGDGFHISTAVRDRVLEGKDSLLVCDVGQQEAFRGRDSIVAHNVRSFMAVPLQTDDQVIGLIYVDTPPWRRIFTGEDLNLLTVMANVAAIRIERERLAEIEQNELLLERELAQAAEIQRRVLPARSPRIPGLDLAGYNAPCRSVGGDYYDFIEYPAGKVGLVIADVAGKGMPAALIMTSLQARVQALADISDDPADVVTRLNRSMAAICPSNRFVTLCFVLLDPCSGELVYCNAGHNPPLLVSGDGQMTTLEAGGPVLGVLPGLTFRKEGLLMGADHLLLLYSDGITEAANQQGEEFGEERLAGILKQKRDQPADSVIDAVHEAVEGWTAGQPAADDITVVAARLTPR